MIDAELIARARAVPIERVIERRGVTLRGKIERTGPCPRCGGDDRFAINTRSQEWNCRGCKPKAIKGNIIGLVMWLDNVDFATAVETLTGKTVRGREIKPQAARLVRDDSNDYEREQHRKAASLWSRHRPIYGTPAERYLREARAIICALPATLAYLPPSKPGHHPAMIVAYGIPDEPEPGLLDIAESKVTAVQLTLLKPDGRDKADVKPNKLTVGSPTGLPMVVAPPNDLLGLAICEGVEDALTAHQPTGLGAWASGGAGYMPRLALAVPDYIEAVTIYQHQDDAGKRGAGELADALLARSVEVFIEGAAR